MRENLPHLDNATLYFVQLNCLVIVDTGLMINTVIDIITNDLVMLSNTEKIYIKVALFNNTNTKILTTLRVNLN